jgi:simple sugar transport system substrate-binding protein
MKHLMKLTVTAALLATSATAAMADGAKIAVVGGKSDDPFFAKIKKGIDDAAMVVKAHGGSVNYLQLQTYDNIGGDAANLIRTAISQHASVITAPDWVSDTEDEAYKAATAAGIPVMLYNAGGPTKPKSSALSTISVMKSTQPVWPVASILRATAQRM